MSSSDESEEVLKLIEKDLANQTYFLKMKVEPVFYKFIVGKGGKTKAEIQSQT